MNTKKLLSALLALMMVLSLLPMAAYAEELTEPDTAPATVTVTATAQCYSADLKTYKGTFGTKPVTGEGTVTIDADTFGKYITLNNTIYQFKGVLMGNKLHSFVTTGTDTALDVIYVPHSHCYVQRHDRHGHWMQCACGSKYGYQKHVDPATDADSTCTCGYHFSSNADLVTLWLKNMDLSPRFHKDTTEYTGNIFTYKDVTSTHIAYRTLDALATVEISGGTAIHDGMNVFEITVTAEDRKTTKTYTVYACKPINADGVSVVCTAEDGEYVASAAPRATLKRDTASLTLSAAAAEALGSQAAACDSAKMILEPQFSKWSTKKILVSFDAEGLAAMAEACDADLVIRTFLADVVIPNDQLAALAEEGDTITFQLTKEPMELTVLADEAEIATPSGIEVKAN